MTMKDHKLIKTGDLKDGEMKAVDVADTKILLCKVTGKFYAVGAVCPHYGAPLDTGLLTGTRVTCPWHHAAFDVTSGDLLEPPARDGLPRYDTRIEGDDVIVSVPEKTQPFSADQATDETFVILGAGAAGNAAAQAMREADFRGHILMITREDRLPYDRPNLSKEYLQGEAKDEWMPLRDDSFYQHHNIELRKNTTITAVDTKGRTLTTADGDTITYHKLLVATGGRAERPNIKGADLKNVFTLRSFDDAEQIIAASREAKQAVIVGTGFIGLETASSLRKRDVKVTVVSQESVPMEHVFGQAVGKAVQQAHVEEETAFRLGTEVEQITGTDGVNHVKVKGDEQLPADMVILGVGIEPASADIQGLPFERDGGISVDRQMKVNDSLYAAGDIAAFPSPLTGDRTRIEHWRTAEQQGRIAGFAMAGKEVTYDSVPFFWTDQAGLRLRYVGHAPSFDDVIVDGTPENGEFVAYYIKDDTVLAAAGVGRDKELVAIEALMRTGTMPSAEDLRSGSVNVIERARINTPQS